MFFSAKTASEQLGFDSPSPDLTLEVANGPDPSANFIRFCLDVSHGFLVKFNFSSSKPPKGVTRLAASTLTMVTRSRDTYFSNYNTK